MNNIKKLPGSYLVYLGLSAALWLTYLFLTFLAPFNERTNTLHLTYSQLNLVKLSFIAPYFLIWLIGIFAVIGVGRYLVTIRGSAEERGFIWFQKGISVLLFGLIVSAAVGAIRPFIIYNDGAVVALAVITNYLNILMPFIAFAYFLVGARHLAKLVRVQFNILSNILLFSAVYCLTVFYSWVIFSNPDRQFGIGPNHTGALYLPDLMIIFTMIIPYVAIWALGIFATLNLFNYRKNVQGTIYRHALGWFTLGISSTIVLSIALQALKLFNEFFATAGLEAILIVIYLILVAIAVGYVFMWLGARKLRTIETVI